MKKVKQLCVEFLVVDEAQLFSLNEMKERLEGGLDMLPKRNLSHLGNGDHLFLNFLLVGLTRNEISISFFFERIIAPIRCLFEHFQSKND